MKIGGYGSGILNNVLKLFTVEGIWSFITTWSGQMYYLIFSTFGLVLFGYYFSFNYIIKYYKDIKTDKNIITIAFVVLSLFFLSLLSAVFMLNQSRVDHILYGRYNEGVLLPVLLIGIICIKKGILAKDQ